MLKPKRILFFLFPVFIILVSCSTNDKNIISYEISYDDLYQNAVVDAMVAEENEISDHLINIVETNKYLAWSNHNGVKRVLVAAWTRYPNSYPVGDTVSTWWGVTWVTAVPEVRDWFKKKDVTENNIELRLKQLLGLPMDNANTHFVELWVSPDDLFRPSPDNEITDTVASLDFPENAEKWYVEWFNQNIIDSYFPIQYPWTRLGYTYDWGSNDSEIGVSEFVVKKDSKVVVESKEPTLIYIETGNYHFIDRRKLR